MPTTQAPSLRILERRTTGINRGPQSNLHHKVQLHSYQATQHAF